jgi:hypothetical protein
MGEFSYSEEEETTAGIKKKERKVKRKEAVQGETYWGFSHQVSSFQIH